MSLADLQPRLGQCALCSTPCNSNCGACMKVSYCSKAHQQKHWKSHKSHCFPLALKTSEVWGRYLVATRNIKQGEILLRESPIFSGPHSSASTEDKQVCLSCYRLVTSNYTCSRCGWPLCGEACEMDEQHKESECKIFVDQGIRPEVALRGNYDIYEVVTVLRGVLLKGRDPTKWAKILDLQSHSEERMQIDTAKSLSHSAVSFVRNVCGQKQFLNEEIDHVLGAIGVNAFVSDDGVSQASLYRNGTYLYYTASIPAHDCVPNSAWVIQLNSDFHLRASLPIESGRSITFLYTEATLGTIDRQRKLLESKYFLCSCARCSSPTEFGSFFSAVKCPNSPCKGYLLPANPLQMAVERQDFLWQCETCSGGKTEFVATILNQVEKEIMEVGRDDSFSSVEGLLSILEKHCGKTLHPNHYLLHDVENDAIQRISFLLYQRKGGSKAKGKQDKLKWATKLVDLSKKCLSLADIIWPGFNRHRGRLLYFLQQGLTICTVEKLKGGDKKNDKALLASCRDALLEILLLRKQIVNIFSIEPEGREESFLRETMMEDSEEISYLKTTIGSCSNAP